MIFTTLQDERRDVWSAILDEIRQPDRDPARAAACAYLLHHIIDSAIPLAKPATLPAPSGQTAARRGRSARVSAIPSN